MSGTSKVYRTPIFRTVIAIGGCSLLGLGLVGLSGCMSRGGVRDGTQSAGTSASPVASPLSVTVPSPAHLASINSIVVLVPTLSSDARAQHADVQNIYTAVEQTAQRELGLKIFGRDFAQRSNGQLAGASWPLTEARRQYLIKAGVDAVLTMDILQLTERSGSSVGGEPATVAFKMAVNAIADGRAVWQGTFFYQQEALTDNLLKIGDRLGANGSGAGWASSAAALDRGLVMALRDFGSRREKQFLAKRP